jgi:hypothetical protein
MKRVKTEWDMLKNLVEAGGRAIRKSAAQRKVVRRRLRSRQMLKRRQLKEMKARS